MADTFAYSVPTTISYGVATVYLTALVSRHVYLLIHSSQGGSNSKGKSTCDICQCIKDRGSPLFYATSVSLALFTSYIWITWLWNTGELLIIPSIAGWCHGYKIMVGEIFSASKLTLYTVFLIRSVSAFENTIYQYSSRFMKVLFALLGLSVVVTSSLLPVFGGGHSLKMRGDGTREGQTICVNALNPYFVMYSALLDLSWNMLTLWLFASPLRKMFRDQNSRLSMNKHTMSVMELEMEMLPLKYGLLTGVATCSTFLSFVLLALTKMGILLAMDTCINVTCLVLMTRVWKGTYWRICTPLLSCLSNDRSSLLGDDYKMAVKKLMDHYGGTTELHSGQESM